MKNNLLIIGDSYSTFKGHIPEGYAVYYPSGSHPEFEVDNVEDTWWQQVIDELDLNLVLNNSWSGSTICYTGYNNSDCSKSSSFIFRLLQLKENGFFDKNDINTVFVFGGTNDSWANSPLGQIKFDDFTKTDLYFVLPAICFLVKTLKEILPNADIYCLVNTELKPEITDAFKQACDKYGVTCISFDAIDKVHGHPTKKGMQDIKNTVVNTITRGK